MSGGVVVQGEAPTEAVRMLQVQRLPPTLEPEIVMGEVALGVTRLEEEDVGLVPAALVAVTEKV